MPPADKHVVSVKPSGSLRGYVGYAQRMLSDVHGGRVRLEAAGKAVGKAVSVAEIVKRAQSGLHQLSELRTADDGSGRPCLSIVLAVSEDGLDTSHPGYVAPAE